MKGADFQPLETGMSPTSTVQKISPPTATAAVPQSRRRLEMLLIVMGIVLAWVVGYVWSVDFRRRIAESFTTIAAVGCALLTSTVVVFAASVWRWKRGQGIAGIYIGAVMLLTMVLAAVVYQVSGFSIFMSGGFSSNIGATGSTHGRFWSAADILLFHGLCLMLCGAAAYLVQIDKQSGLIQPTPAKRQFGLRELMFVVLVIAVCASGIAQWRTNFTRFDTQLWSGDKQSRRYMVDDLQRRYPLVNLRYDEIWKLLDSPNGGGFDAFQDEIPGRGKLVIRFPHLLDLAGHDKREVLDYYITERQELRSLEFGGRHTAVKLGPQSDLQTIYESFHLTPVILTQPPKASDRITLEFSLENRATRELNPYGERGVRRHSTFGRLQQWLVHPDGRTENAGIWLIPARVFAPQESFPPFLQDLSTLGYRRGKYRWIVELQSAEGKVLDSKECNFTVR